LVGGGDRVRNAVHSAQADTIVTVDPSASWLGFMNVSNLPSAGGAYQFGSGWGTADSGGHLSGPVLTLAPNSITDPSSYWYLPAGGPGSTGNKTMDANNVCRTGRGYVCRSNPDVQGKRPQQFTGEPYTSVAFIKDFAPNYSSSVIGHCAAHGWPV